MIIILNIIKILRLIFILLGKRGILRIPVTFAAPVTHIFRTMCA